MAVLRQHNVQRRIAPETNVGVQWTRRLRCVHCEWELAFMLASSLHRPGIETRDQKRQRRGDC